MEALTIFASNMWAVFSFLLALFLSSADFKRCPQSVIEISFFFIFLTSQMCILTTGLTFEELQT